MKFFTSYFDRKSLCSPKPLEVDVRCDIVVFHWLVEYIEFRCFDIPLELSVSILMSSHFLQIPKLIDVALLFIKDNINEILLRTSS